jgi:insertion element IS1 protein InsB
MLLLTKNTGQENGGQQKTMVIRDVCPRCQSSKYTKNGHIRNGKQNHQCQACGRQFVECFEQYLIPDDTRALIERLLVERISLRGICRAVGVKLEWLLGCLVQCFEALPDHLHVQPITCHGDVMIQRLAVEADEMSSFVHKKANKQWIWIAIDAETRQVLAFHVGDRSRKSAKRLWTKIPGEFQASSDADGLPPVILPPLDRYAYV